MKAFLYIQMLLFLAVTFFPGDAWPLTKILMHSEYGAFNRVYNSLEYRGNNAETYPVPMINIGTEYHNMGNDGYIFGYGIAYTGISEGSKFNVNHYEHQPGTSIYLPYFFIGNDFGMFSAEIGLGYYIVMQDSNPRAYYNPDGSSYRKEEDGLSVMREKSFVLPNIMIRLLPEVSYHLKIRFGRERFHVVDSLFNIAFVYPYKRHSGEFYFALPTHVSEYFPESNRRFGFNYSIRFSMIKLGATASYLAYNKRGGGDGNMYLFDPDNFSYGVDIEVLW